MVDPRKEFEVALMVERVAARVAAAAKRPTFEKARADVMEYFDKDGWQASSPTLKVPHVTSPDVGTRLWFKPQAVYFTTGKHDLGSARSLHIDIRDVSPEEVMKTLQRFAKV